MSKLGAIALSGEAKNFVFSNIDALKSHLKIIFPMILLVEIINQIGYITNITMMPALTLVPALILYASFALGWHRASLRGVEHSPTINPLRLDREDFKFVGLFFGLTTIPVIAALLIGFFYGVVSRGGGVMAAIGIVAVIVATVFLIRAMLQLSFLLPARSVGVGISFKEARQSSKGLLFPLIGASMIFGLLFTIILVVYSGVVGAVVTFVSGDVEPQGLGLGFVGFILSLPVYISTFVLTALNITALSRAYQWGMQNNQVS